MNSRRGYVDIEIGGRKRTLHFSMNFWCHFTETLNISLNDLDKFFTSENLNISAIRALIYSGLIAYDQEEKNGIDYTIYDVGAWLEDICRAPAGALQISMMSVLGLKISVQKNYRRL